MNAKFLKICGITNQNDADLITSFFPDALGFIFYQQSPRNISLENFSNISDTLRILWGENCPKIAGVFVNASEKFLDEREKFLDIFQLHGDETNEDIQYLKKKYPEKKVWKAICIHTESDLEYLQKFPDSDLLLIDAFSGKNRGGSGKNIPQEILQKIQNFIPKKKKFLIAGGIKLENFKKILEISGADGIDLSSSLEGKKKGVKSESKVEKFFNAWHE